MSKHVLIISTSPRKGGNSDVLADEFARGAQEAGNHVEKVALYDQTVGFCKGCLACQSTGHCVIHDDANAIVEKMLTADVIVFATPIYYYEMCGQMKTMLSSGEAVGRKLDFLVQEMNREANTIGSKATDSQIAHMVVDVKAEIEKIREQIQNIE